MSDHVTGAPTLEERMDDLRAVMDAVGSRRTAVFGVVEGVPMSALFAATSRIGPRRSWSGAASHERCGRPTIHGDERRSNTAPTSIGSSGSMAGRRRLPCELRRTGARDCLCMRDRRRPRGSRPRGARGSSHRRVRARRRKGCRHRRPHGARLAALAAPGEVLVSSTVKDLVAGSGLAFRDQGSHQLKGLPGEWRAYAVETAAA